MVIRYMGDVSRVAHRWKGQARLYLAFSAVGDRAGLEIYMEVRVNANLVEYFTRFALLSHGLAMNRL